MGGVAMPAAKLAAMVLAAGLLAGIVPGTVALSCMSPTDVCKASPGMTFITDPCTADCSKFVQCANGVGYLQSCPPGTIFNPAISNCDWPYNVQCKGNTNPPPVPSPSPKASPPPVPSPSPKASPSPSPSPSNGGGAVLYSGTNVGGTYYYDMRTSCNGEQYAENNGYPRCTSTDPAKYQTLAQLGSNNVVAIDNNVLSANLAGLCGKKVLVYRADGSQVAAPDGGDFFVWDGCAACIGGGRLDFSVSGLTNVNPNACTLGVVPGVSFKVVDQVVKPYVP